MKPLEVRMKIFLSIVYIAQKLYKNVNLHVGYYKEGSYHRRVSHGSISGFSLILVTVAFFSDLAFIFSITHCT